MFGSDRFPVGTKIEYKCDKGYSIKKGTAEATCQQRGNHIDWYPHDARHCEGELVALQEAQSTTSSVGAGFIGVGEEQ